MTSSRPDAEDTRVPDDPAAHQNPLQDAGEEQPSETGQPRVVRRRDPAEMSAEERAFLQRYRADMPPHHDSAWG